MKLKFKLLLWLVMLASATTAQNIRWEQIKPISAQVQKTTPNGNDLLLIEDSEASGTRKHIKISALIAAGNQDITWARYPDKGIMNISSGTGDTIQIVDADYAGLMTPEDKLKLDTITSHPPVTIAEASADLASIDGNQVLTINRQNAIPVAPEYGNLYNWYVTQEDIAPTGWHVPTFAEWETLLNEIDTYDSESFSWPLAGGKIKETGLTHWLSPNTGATNEYEFNMLGGGIRGQYGFDESLKYNGSIWLFTEVDGSPSAYFSLFGSEFAYVYENWNTDKYNGCSIRFIKDDSTDPGTVTDYDGNEYPTVKIGDQVWMAENFRGIHYNDGSPIDGPNFTNEQWAALTTPAYCIYQQTLEEKFADIDYQNRELLESITPADTARWGTKYYPAQDLTAEEVVFDFNAGNNGLVRLESDIELTLQNIPDGAIGSIVLLQDSTGGYVIDSLKSADVYIFVQNDTINQDILGRTLMEYRRVANSLYVTYLIFPSNPINAPAVPSDTEYSENYTGTIYYFSADGSDSNDGLTKSTPKQTLSAASALTLTTGDAVLFNSTDVFEGTVTAKSGVTYGAYGVQSSKPTIYGSDEITGWSVHSGDIYKASSATTINQLFVNDQRLLASREPDSGFFTVTSAPTTSQITSSDLNGALNYTGTQCIIHSSSYGIETKAVTGSSSTTITLASAPFGDVTAGEKFVLVGKLEFLDEAGEWYYDAAADLVYVWLPDSADPSGYTMRGSVADYGLTASSKSNFTVKDIQFAQQKIAGLSLTSSTDYTVNNIVVNYTDQEGIVDYGCENGTYTNNVITGANHQGIESELSDSMLIQNNTITNIALFEELGLSGIGAWYNGSGIYMNGDGNEIYNNRLDEIGYDGVAFYGVNTVKYNYVTNFCRTKNDGGGIYTSAPVDYGNENNKGSIVQYNTILYGWGVDTNLDANANGIYLDESSGGITVENNNIGYCSGWGIFWHKSNNHVTTNNTLFGNGTGFIITRNGDYGQFKHNKIYGLTGQLIAQRINSSPVVTTTVVDSNQYVNHYESFNFNVDWTGSKDWSYWKTSTGFDANTSYDITALAAEIEEKFIVNATSAPVTWYKNNAEFLVDSFTGDSLDATYVLPAYSSKVVTGKNTALFLPYVED